jgi:hypothetical protein
VKAYKRAETYLENITNTETKKRLCDLANTFVIEHFKINEMPEPSLVSWVGKATQSTIEDVSQTTQTTQTTKIKDIFSIFAVKFINIVSEKLKDLTIVKPDDLNDTEKDIYNSSSSSTSSSSSDEEEEVPSAPDGRKISYIDNLQPRSEDSDLFVSSGNARRPQDEPIFGNIPFGSARRPQDEPQKEPKSGAPDDEDNETDNLSIIIGAAVAGVTVAGGESETKYLIITSNEKEEKGSKNVEYITSTTTKTSSIDGEKYITKTNSGNEYTTIYAEERYITNFSLGDEEYLDYVTIITGGDDNKQYITKIIINEVEYEFITTITTTTITTTTTSDNRKYITKSTGEISEYIIITTSNIEEFLESEVVTETITYVTE